MGGVQTQSWFQDIVRGMFAGIDKLLFSLIEFILQGIFDLTSLTSSSKLFGDIYSRIYVLLGIFMMFKLSFSFFQYIIDPESMSGKSEKGVAKLITRSVIMLALLVVLPSFLFQSTGNGNAGLLNRAQNAFLPMLPRVILGITENTGVTSGDENGIKSISASMTTNTLTAFFYPPSEITDICGPSVKPVLIASLDEFQAKVNDNCVVQGTGGWFGLGSTKVYTYSYTYGVSTLVAVLMIAMLLNITIDVGKRVFKLLILEIIAPIPIMSYIDPKSSKDGAFAAWTKQLMTTFLDIFIKLGLLYVILMIIQTIANNDGAIFNPEQFPSDNGLRKYYLNAVLIISLIFFAKEAPKFIKDSLGIKDSNKDSSLFGNLMGVGALAGAVGKTGIGAVGAVRQRYQAAQEMGEGRGVSALKATATGLAGAFRTGKSALSVGAGVAGGKKAGDLLAAQDKINQRSMDRARNNSGVFGRFGAGMQSLYTGQSGGQRDDDSIKAAKDFTSNRNSAKDVFEKGAFKVGQFQADGREISNYKSFMEQATAAYQGGQEKFEYKDINGMNREFNSRDIYSRKDALEDAVKTNYSAGLENGTYENRELDVLKAEATQLAQKAGLNVTTELLDPNKARDANTAAQQAVTDRMNSSKYKKRQTYKDVGKK